MGFILQTGLVHKLNENNALLFLFVPRLMGDLEKVTSESFQFGGIAMFEKHFRETLTMRFGASFNQERFGPYVVPLVYLDWKLSEKWKIKALLPVYTRVSYQANESLSVGFYQFGLITSYHLEHQDYAGNYMERSSIDLSLFARQRINGNIHLEARAGFALSREYAQYDGDEKIDFGLPLANFGDDRVQKNANFNDGPFFECQVGV